MEKEKPYLPFEQDGKTYNLYELPDGFVIKGDLDLSYEDFEKLPDLSKVIVKGSFLCYACRNLISLDGAPKEVGGDFRCDGCGNLGSLEGAPEYVGGDFRCNSCENLDSLGGAPKEVGGNFYCGDHNDNLTNLKGAPKKVGGKFICIECNHLTNLEGAPEYVGGDFDCSHCKNLTSLEGAPKEVWRYFSCVGNKNLTSLVGISPVWLDINCDNELKKKYGFRYSFSFDELESCPVYQEELKKDEERLKQKKKNALTAKKLKYKIMRTIAAENVSDEKDEKTGKRKINPRRSKDEKKVVADVLTSMAKDITD